MNSIFDVRQLLKRFGIFIYIGDRIADLQLMEAEIRELYEMNLIEVEEFQLAILLLKKEIRKEKAKLKEGKRK